MCFLIDQSDENLIGTNQPMECEKDFQPKPSTSKAHHQPKKKRRKWTPKVEIMSQSISEAIHEEECEAATESSTDESSMENDEIEDISK